MAHGNVGKAPTANQRGWTSSPHLLISLGKPVPEPLLSSDTSAPPASVSSPIFNTRLVNFQCTFFHQGRVGPFRERMGHIDTEAAHPVLLLPSFSVECVGPWHPETVSSSVTL